MRRSATYSALFLALVAVLFSFAKFDHCRNSGWGSPDVYIHACYSDLSALYSARGLDHHQWPYSSSTNSVEYPPGTAMVMWATSWLVPHSSNGFTFFFEVNALLIALLFIATVLLIFKMNPKYWYLLPLSPALLASLYINWDMWAVLNAVIAIYFFDKNKYNLSALLLGISIATKFYPIVILIPICLILIRKAKVGRLIRYLFLVLGTWLLLNLPFAMASPTGWWRFFKLNGERGADFGSLWYGLQLIGIRIGHVNFFALISFIIGATAFAYFYFHIDEVPQLATVAFLIVAVFTSASKVYSPQYVVWLTPLAVLAVRDKKLRKDFWIWQAGEMIYHLAVWEYLASYSVAHFGLPARGYALSIFIRLATTIWFAYRLIKTSSTPKFQPQEPEFLSIAADGYA